MRTSRLYSCIGADIGKRPRAPGEPVHRASRRRHWSMSSESR